MKNREGTNPRRKPEMINYCLPFSYIILEFNILQIYTSMRK